MVYLRGAAPNVEPFSDFFSDWYPDIPLPPPHFNSDAIYDIVRFRDESQLPLDPLDEDQLPLLE